MPVNSVEIEVEILDALLQEAIVTAGLDKDKELKRSPYSLMRALSEAINKDLKPGDQNSVEISLQFLNDRIRNQIKSARSAGITSFNMSVDHLNQLARFVGFESIDDYVRSRRNGSSTKSRSPSSMNNKKWEFDALISSAFEDRLSISGPLYEALKSENLAVWCDTDQIKVGDSITASINRGLRLSRFGIVVVSPVFLKKQWAMRELRALLSLEADGHQRILPIWYDLDMNEIAEELPILADRYGLFLKPDEDTSNAVAQLCEVIRSR